MSQQSIQASPELKLFFDRLLEIKKFVKEANENSNDSVLNEIYEKLDALIKEDENV